MSSAVQPQRTLVAPASKFSFQEIWSLLKDTFNEWQADKAPQLGAALAFYSVLSLAPLVVIALAIGGAIFGEEAARGQIVGQIGGMVGQEGAKAIQEILKSAHRLQAGTWASVLGAVTLLFGASGVFGQLQEAMNVIWDVKPKEFTWGGFLRSRFLSFGMVLAVGFLLLVSLVASAVLSGLGTYMTHVLPGADSLWSAANFVLTLGVITVLFAMMFKWIPDTEVAWNDVWIGAFVTALLFSIGKYLLGLYLGSQGIGSSYGAAGSLVVLVVWVYYSAQILFLGAEFTQNYAKRFGSLRIAVKQAH